MDALLIHLPQQLPDIILNQLQKHQQYLLPFSLSVDVYPQEPFKLGVVLLNLGDRHQFDAILKFLFSDKERRCLANRYVLVTFLSPGQISSISEQQLSAIINQFNIPKFDLGDEVQFGDLLKEISTSTLTSQPSLNKFFTLDLQSLVTPQVNTADPFMPTSPKSPRYSNKQFSDVSSKAKLQPKIQSIPIIANKQVPKPASSPIPPNLIQFPHKYHINTPLILNVTYRNQLLRLSCSLGEDPVTIVQTAQTAYGLDPAALPKLAAFVQVQMEKFNYLPTQQIAAAFPPANEPRPRGVQRVVRCVLGAKSVAFNIKIGNEAEVVSEVSAALGLDSEQCEFLLKQFIFLRD